MNKLIHILIFGVIFYFSVVDTEVSDNSGENFHVNRESKHDI